LPTWGGSLLLAGLQALSYTEVCERGLSLRPIGCTPARSVTEKHCCSCSMRLVALYKCYMSLHIPLPKFYIFVGQLLVLYS